MRSIPSAFLYSFSAHNAMNAEQDRKAQLSLGKMRYSLYSSCCSTDLQGHPWSMIFMPFESQDTIFISD